MFNFLSDLPKSFKLFGTLEIQFYAICILTGVILATIYMLHEAKRLGVSSNFVYLGLIIGLPVGIICARIWYVIFNLDKFSNFAQMIGFTDQGFKLEGIGIQGAIMGAFISIYILCKVKKVSLFKVFDIMAPAFLIGQICGRWGNFFNQELYGPVIGEGWYRDFISNMPLLKDYMFINGAYRHPAFLYESLLNLVGLITLIVMRHKFKKLMIGDLLGYYLIWYGTVRIITESIRLNSGVNEPLMAGPIPVSILLSIIFIIVGITWLILKRFTNKIVKEEAKYEGDNPFKRYFVSVKNDFHNTPMLYYIDVVNEIKQNKFDTILFDNDGTLVDTRELIDKSFIYTFERFRPDYELSNEELDSFFGPTLYQTFSKYGKDEEEINEMIKCYREYNIPNHDHMVKAFPYAKETLRTLHKKGYKIGVVSSKKTDLLTHGLDICGLLPYIDLVIGADEVKNHKPAPDGILLAKEKLNGNNVLYVGDALNDIEAAKNANVKSCGVLYISHPEIMLKAKPDYVVNKLNELIEICGE